MHELERVLYMYDIDSPGLFKQILETWHEKKGTWNKVYIFIVSGLHWLHLHVHLICIDSDSVIFPFSEDNITVSTKIIKGCRQEEILLSKENPAMELYRYRHWNNDSYFGLNFLQLFNQFSLLA